VFETAEYDTVRNSIFLEHRYNKRQSKMKGCAVELIISDWQMSMWTGPHGLVIL